MKSSLVLCLLAAAPFAQADNPKAKVVSVPALETASPAANVAFERQGGTVTVQASGGQPATVRLATIRKPEITTPIYGLRGEVRYADIEGAGYLELWSVFPAAKTGVMEPRYFSRTLADSGPLAKLTGKSDWRPFLLPFDRSGTEAPPSALEFNVVLPKGGTVEFRNVQLVEFPDSQSLFGPAPSAAFAMWPVVGAGVICAAAGTWLVLRFRKQRLESELRRMAAMDTR